MSKQQNDGLWADLASVAELDEKKQLPPLPSFDGISEGELIVLTGLARNEFVTLVSICKDIKMNSPVSMAVGVYLMKLHTGHTHKEICYQFKVRHATAIRYMENVRKNLMADFVPAGLSFENVTRSKIIEHTTDLAKTLYKTNEQLITVWDGTYIYTQKSNNHKLQKKTYSAYKHRNLTKPFIGARTNGYIVGVWGPYQANTSDSIIMKIVMKKPGFEQLFQAGDVMVVDRGFRDSQAFMANRGYRCLMPSFVEKGQKQLTNQQANESRLVTKVRYVIEAVNGRLKKQSKMFSQVYPLKSQEHMWDDFRVTCAIHNAFLSRMYSDISDPEGIANRMLARVSTANKLDSLARGDKLVIRHSKMQLQVSTSDTLPQFPSAASNDLYQLACGTYQLSQAKAYFYSHLDEEGDYKIKVLKSTIPIDFAAHEFNTTAENSILARIQLYSRHSNSAKYNAFVLADTTEGKPFLEAILGYCCSCKNGLRTVGCCAHVMSFIWFASHERYMDPQAPSQHMANYIAVLAESSDEETAD